MKVINHANYIADQERIAAIRPQHRDYLAGLAAQGKVAAAGPYTDGTGTLIVYEVQDLMAARTLVENDPFTAHGIFIGCDLRPWKMVFSEENLLKVES